MATICKSSISLFFSLSLFVLSCAMDEGDILLRFKDSVNDPLNLLSSWSKHSTSECNWSGITCSSSSSSISSINLVSFNLSGSISSSICELPNLVHLNLANNLFNQPIPLHLSQCATLQSLNLSNNLIWGTIPDQIYLFQSLKILDFSRNHLQGRIPQGIGSLKHLQILNLGSNLLSGPFPLVFSNLTQLIILDLSQNPLFLTRIPHDIAKLTKLQMLFLQSSGFYGELVPNLFQGLKSLVILDLSHNNITATLPIVGFSLPNLVSFDVSRNKLSGSFPCGICEAKGLVHLGLHRNFFNGSIPNDSINKCMNLETFQVHDNLFLGNFPSRLWSLPRIKLIRAENNNFSGEIPDSISKAAQLEQVQIDNNSFTSKIPHGLGLIRSLYRFSASVNGLYGELPTNLCDSPVMSILNLSHNYLSGTIPELMNCKKIVSLSLAHNNFIGEIPKSLGALPVLTYLDLSHNNLSGQIPQELQNLKLALFNVSFNRLSGRVPASLISGLPASFLQGNPDLCGPGFSSSCSHEKTIPKDVNLSKLTSVLISAVAISSIIAAAVGFYITRRCRKQRSEMNGWRSVFFYPLRVTENDVMMEMCDKNARGNGGTFGRVYIVNLPSGELIAVKKLMNFGTHSEIKTLAKTRHKNITKILGFCYSNNAILLIYEYVARGSLGDLIGKPDFELPWSVRLRIAIGVAQGLEYLHKDYLPHLLHRNLKSTNILLDADYEPKMTDFALDLIIGEAAFKSSLGSDACCYLAPECGYTKRASEEMDTYSFGVILLELITGQRTDKAECGDVVKWVRRKINIRNGALQIIDPKISSASQHEMLGALDIALRCTSVMPEKRPSMVQVLRILHSLHSTSNLPYIHQPSTSTSTSTHTHS
ncbi:probably inactive leucine-rich repeat receptor-like protein kinase At5g06940 isoform X1 [Solanum pennellii]|uniref:Probably inactive leucine-rich repeat receptor-like protein kinase At5g06940 isoform X1 n=1 Tax=Solanum pennellii TaxID=28526 RepID=A0ABM1GAP7_SOLPN|nr:probably inactive leucine-rich repeat receptor-like protein kinase At5g06940 isoform X1 [Solanum pennellii]